MSVWMPYAVVVLVWSTTPLFLHFSTLAFPAALAGGLRMAVAALVAVLVLAWLKRPLARDARARTVYLWMLPGVFASMYCAYLAASRVPSGVISVVYGTSPVLTALLARAWLGEPLPGVLRLAGAGVALAGLVVIAGAEGGGQAGLDGTGMAFLLAAVVLFCVSAVGVKRTAAGLDPLVQTTGGLLLSLPFYALAWLGEGLPLPRHDAADFTLSTGAILYLAIAGSLLGFVCYYRVLQQFAASEAALITVITPVFALLLGALLNGEQLSAPMLGGALLVIAGVAAFLGLAPRRRRYTAPDN
jgi:drug/metabolite transporter (DMT)-like permease